MMRGEVTVQDAVCAVSLMESSMQVVSYCPSVTLCLHYAAAAAVLHMHN